MVLVAAGSSPVDHPSFKESPFRRFFGRIEEIISYMINFLRKIFEDKNSRWFWLINDFLALVIIISTAAVVLETIPEFLIKYKKLLQFVDWIAAIIFATEYTIYIFLAKEKKRYIFSFYGIIDFISFAPTFLGLFNLQFLKILRVARLLRLLRLFRILKVIRIIRARFDEKQKEIEIIKMNLAIYFIAFFILTIIFSVFLFEIEHQAENSQITSIQLAVWSTISGLTSVGFGDTFPVTFLGRLFMGIIMLTGVGFLSIAIVIMGRLFSKFIFGGDITKKPEHIEKVEKENK